MKEPEILNIRAQFDNVLKKHVHRLLDTMPEATTLPFDLATITSLILLVERENEIETFSDSPPDRYTENTLFEDLLETGLEIDDGSRAAVTKLSKAGFITVESNGAYVPRNSTAALVEMLDNMFPGMPGLNLVAYTLQTIDEIQSGRKDIDQALRQFDQTLQSRGISLSKQKSAATQPTQTVKEKKTSNKTVNDRKQAYLNRLSEIRSKISHERPNTSNVSSIGTAEQPKVITLFPRTASSATTVPDTPLDDELMHHKTEDIPPPSDSSDTGPDQRIANEISEPPEELVEESVDSETVIEDVVSPRQTEETDPTIQTEDEFFAGNTQITDSETEMLHHAFDVPESISNEEIIEEKVKKFQEDLAMLCPACKDRKINATTTEKGKTYYVCENEVCGFISWGKPYHFPCPFCQNPFLVEFNTPSGIAGLRCPKATCNYRQDHLGSPLLQFDASPPTGKMPQHVDKTTPGSPETPKKKRMKVIRKRLVRRKR